MSRQHKHRTDPPPSEHSKLFAHLRSRRWTPATREAHEALAACEREKSGLHNRRKQFEHRKDYEQHSCRASDKVRNAVAHLARKTLQEQDKQLANKSNTVNELRSRVRDVQAHAAQKLKTTQAKADSDRQAAAHAKVQASKLGTKLEHKCAEVDRLEKQHESLHTELTAKKQEIVRLTASNAKHVNDASKPTPERANVSAALYNQAQQMQRQKDALLRENNKLRKECTAMNAELFAVNDTCTTQKQQLTRALAERDALQTQYNAQLQELKTVREECARVSHELQAAQEMVNVARNVVGVYKRMQDEQRTTLQQLSRERTLHESAQNELSRERTLRESAQNELNQMRTTLRRMGGGGVPVRTARGVDVCVTKKRKRVDDSSQRPHKYVVRRLDSKTIEYLKHVAQVLFVEGDAVKYGLDKLCHIRRHYPSLNSKFKKNVSAYDTVEDTRQACVHYLQQLAGRVGDAQVGGWLRELVAGVEV